MASDRPATSASKTRLARLCALLFVALIGLGVRLYFDSKNKTPQTWLLQQLRPPSDEGEDLSDVPPEKLHKLQLEIVEVDATSNSSSQVLKVLQNVPYYGYLQLRTKGLFRNAKEPYDAKGNFVDGPIARWKVEKLERFQNGAWKEVSLAQDSSAIVNNPPQQAAWSAISPENIGKWRMKVAVTAECFNDVGDVWQGSARRDLEFELTKDTIARKNLLQVGFTGSANATSTAQVERVPPIKAVSLKPGRPYLSHIEWAKTPPTVINAGVTMKPPLLVWRKLPMPGDADYPLSLNEYSSIQLRVVRRPTEKAWPNYPEVYPLWTWRGDSPETTFTSRGETHNPSISLSFRPASEDKSQPKDYAFAVQCGNTLNATIRVWPRVNDSPATSAYLQLDSSTFLRDQILVGGLDIEECCAHLTINSSGSSYDTTPYRYRIRSTYVDDSSRAGSVEKGGGKSENDTITVYTDIESLNNSNRNGRFSIRSGSRVGDVWVVAEQLDNDNKVVARTNGVKIGFVEPVIDDSSFRGWTAKNGEWQKTVIVNARTPNGRPLSSIPIRLRIKTLTDYPISAAASWLDNTTGKTDGYGRFTTIQRWKFVPGASLNLENYQVEGVLDRPAKASAKVLVRTRPISRTSSTRSSAKASP